MNKNTNFKNRTIQIWNELAPRYHRRWVKNKKGPFGIIDRVISEADIKKGDKILDVACGTGAITRKAVSKAGKNGLVIGVDSSLSALQIAKKHTGSSLNPYHSKTDLTSSSSSSLRFSNRQNSNVHFVLADVERFYVHEKFDKITCNFGIMFFPDSTKTLRNLKSLLKKDGKIVITVHGKLESVPYFGCFIKSVLKFIPDYLPQKMPQVDRFGSKTNLRKEFEKAGFKNIKVTDSKFVYSLSSPTTYWNDYISYLPSQLKQKINKLSSTDYESLKEMTISKAKKYQKNAKGNYGNRRVDFPWQVLILVARP